MSLTDIQNATAEAALEIIKTLPAKWDDLPEQTRVDLAQIISASIRNMVLMVAKEITVQSHATPGINGVLAHIAVGDKSIVQIAVATQLVSPLLSLINREVVITQAHSNLFNPLTAPRMTAPRTWALAGGAALGAVTGARAKTDVDVAIAATRDSDTQPAPKTIEVEDTRADPPKAKGKPGPKPKAKPSAIEPEPAAPRKRGGPFA